MLHIVKYWSFAQFFVQQSELSTGCGQSFSRSNEHCRSRIKDLKNPKEPKNSGEFPNFHTVCEFFLSKEPLSNLKFPSIFHSKSALFFFFFFFLQLTTFKKIKKTLLKTRLRVSKSRREPVLFAQRDIWENPVNGKVPHVLAVFCCGIIAHVCAPGLLFTGTSKRFFFFFFLKNEKKKKKKKKF